MRAAADRGGQWRKALSCWAVFLGMLLVPAALDAGREAVPLSDFAEQDLGGWQEKEFKGRTDYSFVPDENRGWVLEAHSRKAASGLVREKEIDLAETPFLNWAWRVEKLPDTGDERTKAGDDYAARIYVIFKVGPWFWDTRALNYVWSSAVPAGESWPNAYTSKARMIAVRSGPAESGRWLEEKRNVREDIAAVFEIEADSIGAVALMTDTDDSGSEAVAYYGEIGFSAE